MTISINRLEVGLNSFPTWGDIRLARHTTHEIKHCTLFFLPFLIILKSLEVNARLRQVGKKTGDFS